MAIAPTAMLERFKPGWLLTILTLMGLAVLLTLGTWQVERMQWKTSLIQEIEAGLAAEPLVLGPNIETLEAYTPLSLEGRIAANPVYFQGSYALKNRLGTQLLQVFTDTHNRQWLLERGWVPDDAIDDARAGAFNINGQIQISAVTRPAKRSGPFTPDDDLDQGRLYAEDLAKIDALNDLNLQPMVLVLTSGLPSSPTWDGLPQIKPPDPDLPNNHMGYVITWYGLAGALVGVYIAFGLARAKEDHQ